MNETLATFRSDVILPGAQIVKSASTLIGIALCFTGVGILIGGPMIYYGLSRKKGVGGFVGNCPKCDNSVCAARDTPGFDCPSCKVRVVVNQDGEEQKWKVL